MDKGLREQVHLFLQNSQLHDLPLVEVTCTHRNLCLAIIYFLNQTPGTAVLPAELPPQY